MLALALLTKSTGVPASQRLGIRDEVVAIGFDLAVSLRLLSFETEQSKAQAKRIAYHAVRMFNGEPDDDVLDAEYVDKYTDANTEVW